MFFLLSKIFGFLIIPIHWIFISLIASLIHKKRERQWQIATLFMIFFFGNGFIYDELSRLWEVADSEKNKNEAVY